MEGRRWLYAIYVAGYLPALRQDLFLFLLHVRLVGDGVPLPEWVHTLNMAVHLQDDDFGCHPLDAASGWILLQDSAPLLGSPPASPGAQPSTTGIATGYATATASVGFGSHSLEAATGWVPLQCPAPLTACPAASPGPQPPASDTAGPDLGPRTPGFASFCHSGATPRKGPRVPAMFNFLEGNGPSKRNEERVELRWEMGDEPSAPAPTPTQVCWPTEALCSSPSFPVRGQHWM